MKANNIQYRLNFREILFMGDIYTLGILGLYTLLAFIFIPVLSNSLDLILINVSICIGIISISTLATKLSSARIFVLFRRIYIIPLIFLIYTQAQYYIRIINPGLYDDFLMRLDFAIFGVHPTRWLGSISFPLLTEYLQICYMMYFFMPVVQGIELHMRDDGEKFNDFSSMILFAFYVSYMGYFLLPAVGPRFFLHDYFGINNDLPGIFLTGPLRGLIDSGASIYPHSPISIQTINRDCMPSGHTMLTMVNIIMSFRNRSKFRWIFLVIGGSLIFSTVYLRYHYVVDVLAGAILALLVLWLEPKIRLLFRKNGYKLA